MIWTPNPDPAAAADLPPACSGVNHQCLYIVPLCYGAFKKRSMWWVVISFVCFCQSDFRGANRQNHGLFLQMYKFIALI